MTFQNQDLTLRLHTWTSFLLALNEFGSYRTLIWLTALVWLERSKSRIMQFNVFLPQCFDFSLKNYRRNIIQILVCLVFFFFNQEELHYCLAAGEVKINFLLYLNVNPLQYSCLGNSMDRRAWWATVHGVKRVRHEWTTNTSGFCETFIYITQF